MEDYLAATQQTALIDSSDYCWIEVKGPDARKFLNGILTNDINKLQGKSGCYCLILAPKGKILADCFCYTCADYFGLVCTASQKPTILENLKRYIIFQKVEVVDQSEKWGALNVIGPKAKEYLSSFLKELPSEAFAYTEPTWDDLQFYMISKKLWELPGYEFWTHREKIPKLKTKLNLPSITKETQEILRIESAIPLFGVDIDETTIPQEANLYPALSFTKGCFVGQEVVARLEHRGHVGKQLVKLWLEGQTPLARGTKIFSLEDQEIGWITSSCCPPQKNQIIALGYVRYAFLNSGEVKVVGTKAKMAKPVKDKVL